MRPPAVGAVAVRPGSSRFKQHLGRADGPGKSGSAVAPVGWFLVEVELSVRTSVIIRAPGRLVVAVLVGLAVLSAASPSSAAPSSGPGAATSTAAGYRIVTASGAVASFGAAGASSGSEPGTIALADDPDGGWWTTTWTGKVTPGGGASPFGSASLPLDAPVVGMAATPDGRGYWLVASDGGVFSFGDATFHGSAGGLVLNRPVVGMAPTPDGRGYWLVASDGGIFAFGDAHFEGSLGGTSLVGPIVGMAAPPDGRGYWLTSADGGVFAFGGAPFDGSAGGLPLGHPVTGIAAGPKGGYWLGASDGGVFAFGAPFMGAATGSASPVVGIAPVTVAPPGPRVITTTLPDDIAGEVLSDPLAASGGSAPYAWSAIGLPAWLSLDPATGTLHGRPTTPQEVTVDVQVTDRGGDRAAARLSLRVISPLVLPGLTLPEAVEGQPYSAPLRALGGAAPFAWSAYGGIGLVPPGLAVAGPFLTGTPTEAGEFTFTVVVTDADGEQASVPAELQVAAIPLAVATTSLDPVVLGSGLSDQMEASGGIGPYTWTAAGLPYGTVMSTTGLVWGQAQYSGYNPFAVTVTDADGATATATMVLAVDTPFWIGATTFLPETNVGGGYLGWMTANGGTAPFRWSATGLPPGLSIDPSTGWVSGSPVAVGTYPMTVTATDALGFVESRSVTFYVSGVPITLTTTALPSGMVGAPYAFTPAVTGGTAPYTWQTDRLPDGLSFDPATGEITGTPTTAGTYFVELYVTDVAGWRDWTDLYLTVS